MRRIATEPLTSEAFAPFGAVLAAGQGARRLINEGACIRWHDQARPDLDGAATLSVFEAEARTLPYRLNLIERHKLGSQAFLPLTGAPFLVTVSAGPDAVPRAFLTVPHQGVQIGRGVWHGVLTPLTAPGLFAVVDREASEGNLEEHRFADPWTVVRT